MAGVWSGLRRLSVSPEGVVGASSPGQCGPPRLRMRPRPPDEAVFLTSHAPEMPAGERPPLARIVADDEHGDLLEHDGGRTRDEAP